jgi:hypothetical protein
MQVPLVIWKYGATPPEAADLVQDVLQGKSLCYIGCADADFFAACKQYVTSIVCIDSQESSHVQKARDAGFAITIGDPLTADIPDADVYFIWIGSGRVERQVAGRLQGKTVLFGDKSAAEFGYISDLKPVYRTMMCIRENETTIIQYKLAIVNKMSTANKGG